MKLKIILSIILILNFIFVNCNDELESSKETITVEQDNLLRSLATSNIINVTLSTSGYDGANCGIYGQRACLTIYGAISSFKSYSAQYGASGNQLIVSVYPGIYYGSTLPINLYGMNVIFNVLPTNSYYNGVTFSNNNKYGPIFTINSLNSYSSQPTNVVFNGISLSFFYNKMSSGYDNAYFLSIHPFALTNNYTVQFNGVTFPYAQTTPMINVINSGDVFSNGLSSDWSGSRAFDFSSLGAYGINVNFYLCTFGYQYLTTSNGPYIVSPYVPIGLNLNNCTFNQLSSTYSSMFILGRSKLVLDNVQLLNISIMGAPMFTLVNSEVQIKNSLILQSSTYAAQLLVTVGCFIEINNLTAVVTYDYGRWDRDFPLFDIERSSATILNSNIIMNGPNKQNYDQGVFYALNSDISFRETTVSTNISNVLYLDGSNMFGFFNNFYSNIGRYICSSNHQSTFRGDLETTEAALWSTNCDYYDQYHKTISALMYVFVGVGLVLFLAVFIAIIRSCFSKCNQRRKCKKNSHVYAPVCDNDATAIGLCTTTTTTLPDHTIPTSIIVS